jgi:hypothetical protein
MVPKVRQQTDGGAPSGVLRTFNVAILQKTSTVHLDLTGRWTVNLAASRLNAAGLGNLERARW